MTLLPYLLLEALVILALATWIALLALRSAGRLGPQRGRWSRSKDAARSTTSNSSTAGSESDPGSLACSDKRHMFH